MKKCLPETTKVSKEAKECVQECTSEFISFITSEAADRCALEKRKTINGEDILFALHTLGFAEYGVVMKVYLSKYREVSPHSFCTVLTRSVSAQVCSASQHQRSTGKRAQKRAAKEAAALAQSQAEEAGEGGEGGEEEDEEDYPDSVEGEAE